MIHIFFSNGQPAMRSVLLKLVECSDAQLYHKCLSCSGLSLNTIKVFVPRPAPLGELLSGTACFFPSPLDLCSGSCGLYTLETEWQQWPFWLPGQNAEFNWKKRRWLDFLEDIPFHIECIKRCVQELNPHAVNHTFLLASHKLTYIFIMLYRWIRFIHRTG